jgi:nicotinamidase-related amidase
VRKLLFSSFAGTDLDAQLAAHKIDTLVLAGLTTDCCVDSTTRDAFHRGYNCFVVRDACSAYAVDLHNSTLESLEKNYALIVETAEVLGAWR